MMKKIILLTLSAVLLGLLLYRLTQRAEPMMTQANNVVLVDGQQIIQINVSDTAYLPTQTIAAANLPSMLQLNSKNNYGCTRTLMVSELNHRVMLPITGVSQIDLGTHQTGDELNGVCGMGMYRFSIKFQ